MRFFPGVHKYAPILCLQGDMECITLSVDKHVSMAKFWNRLINLLTLSLSNRLIKRIINYVIITGGLT